MMGMLRAHEPPFKQLRIHNPLGNGDSCPLGIPACLHARLCRTLCNPVSCNPPGSSVHGILQARILEWVGISFHISDVSCIGRGVIYHQGHLGSPLGIPGGQEFKTSSPVIMHFLKGFKENNPQIRPIFPDSSVGKESVCNVGDRDSIPGLGRSPGEGNGYPLQYSSLENSMDCIVHGVAKNWTRLSDFHFSLMTKKSTTLYI